MSDTNRISFLDAGIIVILVPAILYVFVFMYEFGYLISFNIPPEFMVIDFRVIVEVLVRNINKIFLVFTFWSFLALMIDTDSLKNPIMFEFNRIIKVPLMGGIIALFSIEYKAILLGTLYVTVLLLFFAFIFPLLTQRKVKGYKEKLKSQSINDNRVELSSLRYFHINRFGYANLRTIIYLIFVSFLMFQIGRSVAITNNSFLILDDRVVIRSYSEYLITCDYDESSSTIHTDEFFLVNRGSFETMKFVLENVEEVNIEP
jgi:hypothetical protein